SAFSSCPIRKSASTPSAKPTTTTAGYGACAAFAPGSSRNAEGRRVLPAALRCDVPLGNPVGRRPRCRPAVLTDRAGVRGGIDGSRRGFGPVRADGGDLHPQDAKVIARRVPERRERRPVAQLDRLE